MNHHYEFFDRTAVDPLWRLQWKTLRAHTRARWFSKALTPGGDGAESLRNLLAFCIDPEPSSDQIERMLQRLTVRSTLKRCQSQFWAMSELMHHYVKPNDKCVVGVEIGDVSGPIAVAAQAFLDNSIGSRTLWAVLKLHSANPKEWLKLTTVERRKIEAAVPWQQMWKPIYRWQGENIVKDDEWTNCLGISDSRLFGRFVLRAYSEKWPAAALATYPEKRRRHFHDFADCVTLARFVESKVVTFDRPSVVRTWG